MTLNSIIMCQLTILDQSLESVFTFIFCFEMMCVCMCASFAREKSPMMTTTLTSFMSIIVSTLTLSLVFFCTQLMTTMLHHTLPFLYLLFWGIKCHLSLFWVPHSRERAPLQLELLATCPLTWANEENPPHAKACK